MIPSLTADKVDFIVGAFSITDKRREVVAFSLPYYIEPSVLVGLKSEPTKVSNRPAENGTGMVMDAKSFSKKIIGVQNASIHAEYVKAYLGQVKTKSYPAADNAVADLTADRVDYIIVGMPFIQPFLGSKKGAAYAVKHRIPNNVVLGEGIAYATRKGDDAALAKIDAAITELKNAGTLDAMIQKWFFGK